MKWLLIPAGLLLLGLCGYLSACAGAQRWLTFREWWFMRTPAERRDDAIQDRWRQYVERRRMGEPVAWRDAHDHATLYYQHPGPDYEVEPLYLAAGVEGCGEGKAE